MIPVRRRQGCDEQIAGARTAQTAEGAARDAARRVPREADAALRCEPRYSVTRRSPGCASKGRNGPPLNDMIANAALPQAHSLQVKVALDVPQDLVIDAAFIAQAQDGPALHAKQLAGKGAIALVGH